MRTDETGEACPATLGEYRDLCAALGGESCRAVQFLDEKIREAGGGRDDTVIAPDSQMRALLLPMLCEPRTDDVDDGAHIVEQLERREDVPPNPYD